MVTIVQSSETMDKKIKNVAYAGFAAKGAVYTITGILAFLAAFNLGGSKAGKFQVIEFLEKQPFGKVLLAVLGTGLVCYAIWRFIQSVQDPENIGSSKKGIVKRVSFFISGLVYLALGIFAIVDIFYEPNSGSGGGGSSFLGPQLKMYAFIAVGLALAGKGIYQFIKAYKGDFLKKFQIGSISDSKKKKAIKTFGYSGLISRGIMTCIISYFFLKAGFSFSGGSESMKGTEEAFSFLQDNSSGPWLMGLVAAGLVCYGIYMFAHARYRKFDG